MTTPAEIVEEARNGKDGGAILELLEQLEERLIELAAIKQAAKDYVTLREVVKPFFNDAEIKEQLASYENLKELVY